MKFSTVRRGLLLAAAIAAVAASGGVARADLTEAAKACLDAGPSATCEPHPDDGYVILKDYCGKTQRLLVATDAVSGIEDPSLLTSDAPNYWKSAWDAAGRLLPNADVMLVLNAKYGRSDPRFHIHIDLIRPGLREELPDLGAAPRSVILYGRAYDARRISSLDVDKSGKGLFQWLADWIGPKGDMACQSLAVTSDPRGGFLVFNGHVAPCVAGKPLLDNGNADALEITDHQLPQAPNARCQSNER